MKQTALKFLKDSSEWTQLDIIADKAENGQILNGKIVADGHISYPIIGGVPSFLANRLQLDGAWTQEQNKTTETFSEKWNQFRNYGMKESELKLHQNWFCKKFGIEESLDSLKGFYRNKRSILEVGTGSGFNCRFMAENCGGYVIGADISDGAFTSYHNTQDLDNILIIQADLMQLPLKHNQFDFVIADGVLHHTPNTQLAVNELFKFVRPGGQFFFYIYKKMGPVKQFTDQYIREAFRDLPPEKCLLQCQPITELGRELAKLDAKITLEKPIPVLGIPAGTHNVQRLIYYNFLKCFWNDALDYETNNMVNYDWYHPHDAWQHSESEVHEWMKELGVGEYKINDANPNGLSVLLTKPLQA